MDQTGLIAAAIIIGFVVFVTVRGELPSYLSVFTGNKTAIGAASAPSTGGDAVSVWSAAGELLLNALPALP